MDEYAVRLNQKAFRDLEDIFMYISLGKLSPENAQRQTERIRNAIQKLENFPQAHQERINGRYAGKGYRQLLVDNYIAIFKIDEKEKIVYIVTIQYQRRNF